MSDDEKMTVDERNKYLRTMKKRYGEGTKKECGKLLAERAKIPPKNMMTPGSVSAIM